MADNSKQFFTYQDEAGNTYVLNRDHIVTAQRSADQPNLWIIKLASGDSYSFSVSGNELTDFLAQ